MDPFLELQGLSVCVNMSVCAGWGAQQPSGWAKLPPCGCEGAEPGQNLQGPPHVCQQSGHAPHQAHCGTPPTPSIPPWGSCHVCDCLGSCTCMYMYTCMYMHRYSYSYGNMYECISGLLCGQANSASSVTHQCFSHHHRASNCACAMDPN